MIINVWLPWSPIVFISLIASTGVIVWKIVKSIIQSIPFVG